MSIRKACYIVSLDQDVECTMAVEYLHSIIPTKLKSVIFSPYPITPEGKQRLETIKALFNKARILNVSDVEICKHIPAYTDTIFVSGSLKEVARYMDFNKVDNVIIHGGFAGSNVLPFRIKSNPLYDRVYDNVENFNYDPVYTKHALSFISYDAKIILIGKNVTHDNRNNLQGIWENDALVQNICKRYGADKDKKLANILMCKEGIQAVKDLNECMCAYYWAYPMYKTMNDIEGKPLYWGSNFQEVNNSALKMVSIAAYFKDPKLMLMEGTDL